jgi:hypothetical protein
MNKFPFLTYFKILKIDFEQNLKMEQIMNLNEFVFETKFGIEQNSRPENNFEC